MATPPHDFFPTKRLRLLGHPNHIHDDKIRMPRLQREDKTRIRPSNAFAAHYQKYIRAYRYDEHALTDALSAHTLILEFDSCKTSAA